MAQTQSRLTGLVTDDTGAIIVGAKINVRNVATGVLTEAASNESGNYLFPFLVPGGYDLTCELQGFKKLVRAGVALETGSTHTLDLKLEVGAVTETVEVRGSTPLLESESSTVGQFIERTTVFNMPLESRRTASLVRLLGTVVYKNEAAGEQIPYFSMAGGRSQNQMWQLDGGIVQNMALGVAQIQLNPPSESLQEFKAEVNNYSAEFGRAGNGLILMTTRSGTNQLHGAAYEFLRNQAVDTRTFFAPAKAPLRYNIFGGSVGGPIRRDRTFFFVNYEGARRRDGSTSSGNIVPRPAELRGDFSARRDIAILDPVNNQPFSGNIIPSSRIDPLARQFASFWPAPNVPGDDPTRAPGNNYTVNVSDKLTQDYSTARVDHSIGGNDRVYGRYSAVYAPQEVASLFPTDAADTRGGIRENHIHNAVGNWIHNFSPAVINEARYMYSNRLHINRAFGTGSKKNGEIGLPGVNPDAFATIGVTGHTGLGSGTHERIQTPIMSQQVTDNVTIIRGKHSLKTGFEFRYSLNKDDFNQQTGGSFSFSDRATRSGIATLLLGWTSGASLVDTDLLEARTDYYGAYVQDDWKISKNLTLNLGIRWELDTPRWERIENRQSGFDPVPVNPVAGVPGIVTFSGRDGRSKYAHNSDKNNIGPRFGFAWKTWKSAVIRGGYGISYAGEYAGAVPFALTNGFGLNGSFSSPDGGFTPAFMFRTGMPKVEREPLTPGFGSVRVGQSPRLSPDFFVPNHVNGYSQQYNLTIQKEVLGNLLFEAAYIAHLAHKLGGQDININMIPLVNGRGPAAQSQTARPFPQFTNVVMKSPAWGNSTYHALNVKLEKRYSSGLNFLMNYTWSKFLDDVEGNTELAGGEGNGYTHIQLHRLDKSYSGNDVRHRYIASSVYELPVGKGKKLDIRNGVANAVVGGWTLGAVAEFRSGPPYGSIEQTNTTNTFSNSQRPNLVCDPALDSGRARMDYIAQWFNTSCFQAPGTGIFGSAARINGVGPGLVSIDLSVNKRWQITERYNLQFRSDFYNLPNRPNFDVPNAVRGRGDFGRLTRTLGTGRQIQLSMRLEF
ncbi:MAG: TonB-dependent receptor [Acidobacteria bacterium]|nr:TonB-dependent receptor [Acidobacteriota bacterium]